MWRERALKVVLVLVGFLFTAGVYPLIGSLLHPADSDTGDTMMLSLYVTLGLFLLIAVRNPSAHRSVVKLRPCRGDVDPRTRNSESKSRIFGRIGCARCHRRSVDRAQPGEAARRAGTGSRSVGSDFAA